MDKAKQVGHSNPSSTFTTDLFGPKDSSSRPTTSSSSGIFSTVFGPASTGRSERDAFHKTATTDMEEYKNIHGSRNNGVNNKVRSPIISENEVASNIEPCYFNSSIYYGGQQNYSPNNTTNPSHHDQYKRDELKDDDSGNNSNSASRGNWWQGSLYY